MADRDADPIGGVLAAFPRERTRLLPALRAAQEAVGHLPDPVPAEVAPHLRVPASEVWDVATGHPEFRLAPRGRHHVRVCTGASCALLGGAALLAEAIAGACSGMCCAAPAVEIARPGWPRAALERVRPGDAHGIVAALASEGGFASSGVVWSETAWRGLVPVSDHPFWQRQERVLLARCGATDPEDLDDALLHGAYRALAGALDRTPLDVIEAVKTLLRFNAQESRDKCTPCREGTPRLLATLDEPGPSPEAEARPRELLDVIQLASLCGLGQAAPLALRRAFETFPDQVVGRP